MGGSLFILGPVMCANFMYIHAETNEQKLTYQLRPGAHMEITSPEQIMILCKILNWPLNQMHRFF